MNLNPSPSVSSVVKKDLSRRPVTPKRSEGGSPDSSAKADPYSNKTHRRIDIALIVITLLMMFFAFRPSGQHRQSPAEYAGATQPAGQNR